MPRRREPEPIVKVNIALYVRDVLRMKELYPTQGYSKAIRQLVRAHLSRYEKTTAAAGAGLADEIDFEVEDV